MSLEELEVRRITEKVLKEQNLYNLADLYKKEHDIFRGTHKELPLHYTKEALDNFFEGEVQDKKQVHWDRVKSKPDTYPPSSHEHDDRYYTESELDEGQLDTRYYTESEINTLLAAQNEFKELADTPSAYTGHSLKNVRVNVGETALEFVAPGAPGAHAMIGALHTASGLTVGEVIKATGETTMGWMTLQHSELGGVTSDLHHTQDHSAAHHTGGGDLVYHDSLSGFVATEHKVLPNTIAEVLSNHTKAVHDALGIDVTAHAMIGAIHTASGLTIGNVIKATGATTFGWMQLQHSELGGVTSNLHHAQLHSAAHHSGGGDLVYHDSLSGFVASEHKVLPNTIAQVLSDHTVAIHDALNINADRLDGYHASMVAGNSTVVVRSAAGYIFCNYLNCTSGATTSEPTHYFVEIGNDSYLRQMTPANFVAKLVADGLMPKSGGAFTGYVYARDHGTAATDMLVNVCYGTGSPPTANTTTLGTLFVKYTA